MRERTVVVSASFALSIAVVCQLSRVVSAQSTNNNVSAIAVSLPAPTPTLPDTQNRTDEPLDEMNSIGKLPFLNCTGLIAFERTLDSAVSPAMILNEANRTQTTLAGGLSNRSTELTFPCNRQCSNAEHCVAYITDYNKAKCLLLYQRPKQSRAELTALAGFAYYEKICLNAPGLQCKKEWAFERVVGMELVNNDDLVLHSVANRMDCMSACLQEQSFVCRSAEYHYQTSECRLSRHSRRTLPQAFHPAQDQVDYLENQCAPEPNLCEFRAVEENLFSVETELDNTTSIKECETYCHQEENFVCRAYRYDEDTKTCVLSADDRISLINANNDLQQTRSAQDKSLTGFMERGDCVDVSMSCGPNSMTAILKLNRPFNGRFYPADKPNLCVVVGNNDFQVELTMQLEGNECGSKSLGNGTFVNDVVVQMHPIVLRDSDRRIRIACDYPASKVTLIQDLTVEGVPPRFMDPNHSNVTQTVSGVAALPKVRLQIRNGSGKEVQGAQLGDPLILSIDMLDEASAFGISASDLVAMSGAGDETLQLVDGRGCPVEPSIFPAMAKIKDDHSLTSRFAAFKFASDSIVKFRVTVSFCLDKCPLPDCSGAASLLRKRRSAPNNATSVEDRELTMELAILVDTENNRAPTIGKDGVVNEAQLPPSRSLVCTKTALVWALGITAAIIQVATLSCCLAFIAMYRRLKRQKGNYFEPPSTASQTMAWSGSSQSSSSSTVNNPDVYRLYK
ncbi:uncharacterized protein LOC129593719 [Paramacrobiotus metropolitanus]|uniref:uncharacterized protein LOC129593719 n=1 Tax=Paramacrobiotus metropolitanus TaxID=2943436 RepID=UPI002445AABB|nr:uncharacterized protein LOC129593719 [Paramacrobiotus metropolitanus]